jgi:hypothetical protein
VSDNHYTCTIKFTIKVTGSSLVPGGLAWSESLNGNSGGCTWPSAFGQGGFGQIELHATDCTSGTTFSVQVTVHKFTQPQCSGASSTVSAHAWLIPVVGDPLAPTNIAAGLRIPEATSSATASPGFCYGF